VIWLLRIVLGLTALGWLAGWLKAVHRKRHPRFVLGPGDPPCDPELLVSVVIPARNEIDNLADCLEAVLAQDHPALQVVVLDDGSTDGTTEVLAALSDDPRVTVVTGGDAPLPEGWFGKPWALERAQRHARGDWLFFIDADVRLAPEAVSRVIAYGQGHELGMVSGLGSLEMRSFWERVLQPAIGGLVLAGNDLDKVNDPEAEGHDLANGQLIALSRGAYERVGRHAAVKADILDDIGLARACRAADVPYHCLYLRELFSCRMYGSLREIWEGWGKNLFAGLRYSWGNLLGALVFTALFTQSGPLLIVFGVLGGGGELLWWGLGLTALMQVTRLTLDLIWGLSPLYGLTHAPANLAVMALMVSSAARSSGAGVSWKGRVYRPGETGSR